MGVLAVSLEKIEQALSFFKKALEVNPGLEQYWVSMINALIKLERFDDARALLNQAASKGIVGKT